MKFLKYWAIVALLCVVSAVSFYGGREYEAYYYNFDSLFEAHQKLKDRNNLFEYIDDVVKSLIVLPLAEYDKYNSTGSLGVSK